MPKNQSHVFPRNNPGLQREETTTKRPGSQNIASIISHPLHISTLFYIITPIFFSTLLQEVTQFDYLGLRLDAKNENESCSGIHLKKGKQRPFSSSRCLLFPLL